MIEPPYFNRDIHLRTETFKPMIGFLLIVKTIDLDVAQDNFASTLLTKALDFFILIQYSKKLLHATDVMGYVIENAQKNLIMIIHTVPSVSTLFYTIDIKTPIRHGKITFVLQPILETRQLRMISLHLRFNSKIMQDTGNS